MPAVSLFDGPRRAAAAAAARAQRAVADDGLAA